MIGDNIRRLRLERGMSQEELALKVGYNGRSSISKIEKNERGIPTLALPLFTNALGCSVSEILGEQHPGGVPERLEYLWTEVLTEARRDMLLSYAEYLAESQRLEDK